MTPDETAPEPLTAAQRLAAALGQPLPLPLSADEFAELEAAQDRADADAELIWGVRG